MRAVSVALCAVLVLASACKRQDPNAIDASAFEAIAQAADYEMNAPVAAIYELLRTSANQPQVAWDSLILTSGPTPEPVNWWFLRKGWVQLSGSQFVNRPVFNLTETATAILATPDEPWFSVAQAEGSDPEVDCESPAALATGGCQVSMLLQPELTDTGRRMIGAVELPAVRINTVVRVGIEDWEVEPLDTEGEPLYDRALTAILGDEEARIAARREAASNVSGRIEALSGAAPGDPFASAPATPYVDPEPAAPVTPQDSRGALGLGMPEVTRER